jgi:predicted nicotinamide N-methyase
MSEYMENNEAYVVQGIKLLHPSDRRIRRIKRYQQRNTAHGNKIWLSSFVLMDFIAEDPPAPDTKAIEIGCGWGAPSIMLAKKFRSKMIALDIDAAVEPLLKLHCELNACKVNFRQADFGGLTEEDLAAYRLLIASDICFWDHLVDPAYKLIKIAQAIGTLKIVIADPGRPPFWDLVHRLIKTTNVEVVTRTIYEPRKTRKFILCLD